ncbi:response regulator [Duganella fentianensis]|uniref:response regulator n=1 Tax=Duganella fentianensis TaxID=2692177 RepID=UPI0032B2F360
MSRTMSDQQAAEIEWSLLEQPELGIAAEVPRVLLIDADADAVLVLTALLVPENQVCVADSRAAAVSLLQQDSYALVVLDPAVPALDTDAAIAAASAPTEAVAEAEAALVTPAPAPSQPDLLALVRQYHGEAPLLLYSALAPHTIAGARGLSYLAKPWSTPRQLWHAISELLGSGAVLRSVAAAGKENSALV